MYFCRIFRCHNTSYHYYRLGFVKVLYQFSFANYWQVIQKYYLRTSRQIRILDLEAKSPLYSHFIESLSGLVTIRAFGWSETFQVVGFGRLKTFADFVQERSLMLLDISQKPYYLLFCIQRWLALVLDLLVMVLAVILMSLVVKLVGILHRFNYRLANS